MLFDYTSFITSEHDKKPNFLAFVTAVTQPLAEIAEGLQELPQLMIDVDIAEGVQLDVIGLWVGISRKLTVPIEGVYFSLDTDGLGFDQGVWKGPFDPTQGLTSLDDFTYRTLLRAKIAANYWDGTTEDLEDSAINSLAPVGVRTIVIDHYDMSVTIYIVGSPSAAVLELIKREVFPPKAAGVRIREFIYLPPPDGLIFALDTEVTEILGGLDFGAFGIVL